MSLGREALSSMNGVNLVNHIVGERGGGLVMPSHSYLLELGLNLMIFPGIIVPVMS